MTTPTTLEGLLEALACAAAHLRGGEAVAAAEAVARAVRSCGQPPPGTQVSECQVAYARTLLAHAETLATALQQHLEEELRRTASSARAGEAYARSASGV